MQQFQRLDHLGRSADPRHAQPVKERPPPPASLPAREPVCDSRRGAARPLTSPISGSTTGLPSARARGGHGDEGRKVAHPFDIAGRWRSRGHPSSRLSAISERPDLRLVADCHDIGQRQAAGLHRQVQRKVRGLGSRWPRRAGPRSAPCWSGQSGGTVEQVEEAVAIRAQNAASAPAASNQRRLQRPRRRRFIVPVFSETDSREARGENRTAPAPPPWPKARARPRCLPRGSRR